MDSSELVEIECLACGDVREVGAGDTQYAGECASCGYVGWSFVADLDVATQQMIQSGLLARRTRVWSGLCASRLMACDWQRHRSARGAPIGAPRRI